jgi:hypothetical protein
MPGFATTFGTLRRRNARRDICSVAMQTEGDGGYLPWAAFVQGGAR